ncbi:hypothetical protein [Hydrogenophaga pseudoflava]|uniref:hypothetical protein n=1 Tax=Hydrogenophaga pseudoflava TaxID=47421 RepID=UPI0027E4F552|nr:hypothetical protein [Hydrogenophaga pseudoflava]MDQ7745469.1 hypothetical protein [Hydrogenophaga pseudoflava]
MRWQIDGLVVTLAADGGVRVRAAGSPPPPPPPPPSGDITVALVASRISGPAPLAVRFSAVGTTTSIAGVTDTFRQLLYTFDYGDPGSGTWPISGGSKNSDASGPLGAHIFDTPGTYVVRCTGGRGGSSGYGEVTITVTDPATVFPGTATVYISPSANYSGAPAGAELRTTMPVISSNKRYMLARGESHGALLIPGGVTGTQVVAGGSGAKPLVSTIKVGDELVPPGTLFPDDITIEGLQCSGEIVQTAYVRRLLLKDIDQPSHSKIDLGAASDYWSENLGDRYGPTLPVARDLFVVGCYSRGTNLTFGITGHLIEAAVLGCDFKGSAQHTLRAWSAYHAVISHNALRGGSADGIRHALKMHSSGVATFTPGQAYGSGAAWATSKVVVYRNLFSDATDNNAFAAVFGPQNDGSAEPLEDVIVEGNVFARGSNFVSDLQLAGRRMTYIGNTLAVGGGAADVTAPGLHAVGLPVDWQGPYFNSRD